jgi:prephenate dehydrogenase
MDVATANEDDRRTMLRLAAGGFRDMTRIAAGHPGIWPDILTTNRDAVLAALDAYIAALLNAREIVASGAREDLLALLERARAARRNLPVGVSMATKLVEFRVPVPDRPGVLAEVTTLAGRLGVNVYDVEIAHSMEGGRGVIVMIVAAIDADAYDGGLRDLGYHVARTDLE